jgi:hypothetical protein
LHGGDVIPSKMHVCAHPIQKFRNSREFPMMGWKLLLLAGIVAKMVFFIAVAFFFLGLHGRFLVFACFILLHAPRWNRRVPW